MTAYDKPSLRNLIRLLGFWRGLNVWLGSLQEKQEGGHGMELSVDENDYVVLYEDRLPPYDEYVGEITGFTDTPLEEEVFDLTGKDPILEGLEKRYPIYHTDKDKGC